MLYIAGYARRNHATARRGAIIALAVVHCGAISNLADHTELSFERWREMIDVNRNGTYLIVFAVKAAKRLGPHTVAVHAKDMEACRHVSPEEWYFFSSVTVGTGLIDMPGVVKALEDSGFTGVLTVESDHHKDNQDEIELVANSVAYLKKLLGKS